MLLNSTPVIQLFGTIIQLLGVNPFSSQFGGKTLFIYFNKKAHNILPKPLPGSNTVTSEIMATTPQTLPRPCGRCNGNKGPFLPGQFPPTIFTIQAMFSNSVCNNSGWTILIPHNRQHEQGPCGVYLPF